MTTPESFQIARIAFRQEGDMWVAYFAKNDTMKGAVVMGSIHMKLIGYKDIQEIFMDTMRNAVALVHHEASGRGIEFGKVVPGPESERSGRA